jgi:hypothetical protein
MRRDHEGKLTSGRGLREKIDPRADWQIRQGERCGCRATDDLCACQNAEEPWKYGLGGVRPPTLEQELLAACKAVNMSAVSAIEGDFSGGFIVSGRAIQLVMAGIAKAEGR